MALRNKLRAAGLPCPFTVRPFVDVVPIGRVEQHACDPIGDFRLGSGNLDVFPRVHQATEFLNASLCLRIWRRVRCQILVHRNLNAAAGLLPPTSSYISPSANPPVLFGAQRFEPDSAEHYFPRKRRITLASYQAKCPPVELVLRPARWSPTQLSTATRTSAKQCLPQRNRLPRIISCSGPALSKAPNSVYSPIVAVCFSSSMWQAKFLEQASQGRPNLPLLSNGDVLPRSSLTTFGPDSRHPLGQSACGFCLQAFCPRTHIPRSRSFFVSFKRQLRHRNVRKAEFDKSVPRIRKFQRLNRSRQQCKLRRRS